MRSQDLKLPLIYHEIAQLFVRTLQT